jgi:hypothetical protein
MSMESVVCKVRLLYRDGALDQAGVKRHYLNMGFDEHMASGLTEATINPDIKLLELTPPELRKLLDLSCKEMLRNIYHGATDPTLSSLLHKGTAAAIDGAEDHVRQDIPG